MARLLQFCWAGVLWFLLTSCLEFFQTLKDMNLNHLHSDQPKMFCEIGSGLRTSSSGGRVEANSKPMYQPWNEEEFQADVFVRGMTWLQRHLYRALLQASFFHGTRP